MPITIREFEKSVADTLLRIANSSTITNTNSGSVIRTIVESILAENDIQYYQLSTIYDALGINEARGSDLDRLIAILGITRKPATKCTGKLLFSRTTPHTADIFIEYGNIISTLPDRSGKIIEFIITEKEAVLKAGELEVYVECEAVESGDTYVPTGALNIMNIPIAFIESVRNDYDIYGGTNAEEDDVLRERAKESLSLLGKGTSGAIKTAVKNIPGVSDAIVIDMPRGVGTVDVITVTSIIPPPIELENNIKATIHDTKSSGIKVDVVYPTILSVDIDVDVINYTDASIIGGAIVDYFLTLKLSELFIVNQMERAVLNACNDPDVDIVTKKPTSNIVPGGTEVIRHGTITINGVVWSE